MKLKSLIDILITWNSKLLFRWYRLNIFSEVETYALSSFSDIQIYWRATKHPFPTTTMSVFHHTKRNVPIKKRKEKSHLCNKLCNSCNRLASNKYQWQRNGSIFQSCWLIEGTYFSLTFFVCSLGQDLFPLSHNQRIPVGPLDEEVHQNLRHLAQKS